MAAEQAGERLARGQQLPRLRGAGLGGEVDTRQWYWRRNLVVLFTHAWPCPGCAAYVEQLAEREPAIAAARGQLLVVVALGPTIAVGELTRLGRGTAVLLDEDGALHGQCGLRGVGGQPVAALVVTDDLGTIYAGWDAGTEHAFPAPDEVVSWVEFVSYQCRECGADSPVVLDG